MLRKQAAATLSLAQVLLSITLVTGNCSLMRAASYTWQVSSGDWSTPSNWGGGKEPNSTDYACIQNGSTAEITQTGEVCRSLYVADYATVQMQSGALTASAYEAIGCRNQGTFTQTGGINTISSALYVGDYYVDDEFGGRGTYFLSGGT
jgi:hypothetical protein